MAQIPDTVKNVIEKYLTALKEHNIPIRQVFLFGSYAKGNSNEWSDIDLALVSEIFEGVRIQDRKKIRPITLSISSEIEVLPYRPSDFTPDDPFVKEILDTGVRIV
jgi:predicted nucleotidyltransferase